MKAFLLILFLLIIQQSGFAQAPNQNLANQYLKNGEPEKALVIFRKLYQYNNELYFPDYFSCLLKLKNYTEAENIVQKLIKKNPQDFIYTIYLSDIYKDQGHLAKASLTEDAVLKALPADASKIMETATLAYSSNRQELAIKIFQQGRKILNDPQLFSYQLISLYRFKRDKYAMANEYMNLLQNNPEYLLQAQNNISAQFDQKEDYDQLRVALLKLIQKQPQNIALTEMLTWQFLQQKEFDLALTQCIALNKRLNEQGDRIYLLCQTLVANEAYDAAIKGFQYIINNYNTGDLYIPSKIELINAKNQKIVSGNYTKDDLNSLVKDYNDLLQEFGRNNRTAFAMQQLAELKAFKLHELADAEKLLEELIKIKDIRPDLIGQCKIDLADIYLLDNQPWEASLLYSQVEKDLPESNLAQEARYRNARLAYYSGDFTWAKAQLDILKAASSQLIANDALNLSLLISDNLVQDSTGVALKMYARADFLIFKEQYDKAELTLDSISQSFAGYALGDDVLMAKAKIGIQKREFERAVTFLMQITTDYATDLWADDAVFMMADIYETKLHDRPRAQVYFQKIITDYPGSLWLNEARIRYRTLRGDAGDHL